MRSGPTEEPPPGACSCAAVCRRSAKSKQRYNMSSGPPIFASPLWLESSRESDKGFDKANKTDKWYGK